MFSQKNRKFMTSIPPLPRRILLDFCESSHAILEAYLRLQNGVKVSEQWAQLRARQALSGKTSIVCME